MPICGRQIVAQLRDDLAAGSAQLLRNCFNVCTRGALMHGVHGTPGHLHTGIGCGICSCPAGCYGQQGEQAQSIGPGVIGIGVGCNVMSDGTCGCGTCIKTASAHVCWSASSCQPLIGLPDMLPQGTGCRRLWPRCQRADCRAQSQLSCAVVPANALHVCKRSSC